MSLWSQHAAKQGCQNLNAFCLSRQLTTQGAWPRLEPICVSAFCVGTLLVFCFKGNQEDNQMFSKSLGPYVTPFQATAIKKHPREGPGPIQRPRAPGPIEIGDGGPIGSDPSTPTSSLSAVCPRHWALWRGQDFATFFLGPEKRQKQFGGTDIFWCCQVVKEKLIIPSMSVLVASPNGRSLQPF